MPVYAKSRKLILNTTDHNIEHMFRLLRKELEILPPTVDILFVVIFNLKKPSPELIT